jgi:hypothetical protein
MFGGELLVKSDTNRLFARRNQLPTLSALSRYYASKCKDHLSCRANPILT